jgi:hypothetical protein
LTRAVAQHARERLTWAQICEKYPNEWVVIVDMKFENDDEDDGDVESAIVLTHSKGRRGCLEESKQYGDEFRMLGHFYTGPLIPPGAMFTPRPR